MSETLIELCRIPAPSHMEHKRAAYCNILLSIGIPAICMGVYSGGGSHTREEWVEKASLVKGLELDIKTVTAFSRYADN